MHKIIHRDRGYTFEWHIKKELESIKKHGIPFGKAIEVFSDPKIIHVEDDKHSSEENRLYAIGKTLEGKIITVRYTLRGSTIRVFGAAYWRKYYEKNT